jgi:hypothetical protein
MLDIASLQPPLVVASNRPTSVPQNQNPDYVVQPKKIKHIPVGSVPSRCPFAHGHHRGECRFVSRVVSFLSKHVA